MPNTLAQHLSYLSPADVVRTNGRIDVEVSAPFVESDRDLRPGGVFIARQGKMVDGHDFIPQAVSRGAVAIIGERDLTDVPVPYVQVRSAQSVIGLLAASYWGFPSRDLTVIGVTGTDGKTTTSHLLHSVLKHATGGRAGFISTIAADFGSRTEETGLHVTTPGAPQVQAYLAQMVESGLTHVVLEMTSHGLQQGRLNGVDVDVAVLTNITHEHLDFHGTWEAYRDAKAILFRNLSRGQQVSTQPRISVINADDPSFAYFAAIPTDRVVSYAVRSDALYRATDIEYLPDETRFKVGAETFSIRLVGEFNVMNALAAIATARSLGFLDLQPGLSAVEGISGRMERIDEGQDFIALVDFAHTPNALRSALQAARTMLEADRRLIAVFGSAGLRDVDKRRAMAEVSAELADITVLTAEDPRTESLDDILQMMADGCKARGGVEGETFYRVPDRGQALYHACQLAGPGDLVIACGKGHEQSMCFGVVEYPWDDREALRAALRGNPLRTLPTAGDS